MTTATENLPITETVEPADVAALAARVREAYEAGTAVYPIGGGTSSSYGLPGRERASACRWLP